MKGDRAFLWKNQEWRSEPKGRLWESEQARGPWWGLGAQHMPSGHLEGKWEGAQDSPFVIVVSDALYFGDFTELVQTLPEKNTSLAISRMGGCGQGTREDNLACHSRLLTAPVPPLGLSGGAHPGKQQALNPCVALHL